MEDYEFDVFLSYKRHERVMHWVEEVYGHIDFWLEQELGGRPTKIFFDKNTIETGANWPDDLKIGAKKSRCMVGIWSPSYFRSKWCIAEWQSFYQRQLLLTDHQHNIILPMRFHDGDMFPSEAQNIQSIDVRKYTFISPSFWNTTKSVELEELIKQLCSNIAKSIRNAPPFDPTWPTPEPDPTNPKRVELMQL